MADENDKMNTDPSDFNGMNRTPFIRVNKIERTPQKSSQNLSDSIQAGQKRPPDSDIGISNEVLYDKLINRFNVMSNEIKAEINVVKENVEKKIDERFNEMKEFMNKTERRLGALEVKVEINDGRVDQNTKAINYLNQKELQNKIDIMGAEWPAVIEREKIKEEAFKMIRRYVDIEMSLIKTAYLRTIQKKGIKVMVVEFIDFETKLRIMKGKRQSNNKDGIYFDNSLTPLNGKLMGGARKVSKEKNFKAYLNNGKICVRKSNDSFKWIESEADLEEVKAWLPNNDQKSQKNGKQQLIQPSEQQLEASAPPNSSTLDNTNQDSSVNSQQLA